MNNIKIIGLVFFSTLIVLLQTETAEAQRRRGRDRVIVRINPRPSHRIVVRRAHIRYAGMPRWGSVVTVRPAGATILRSRRNNYYVNNGIYYSQHGVNYVIVRPSRGLRIGLLPVGYRTVLVGSSTYYYYYGTYYSSVPTTNGYETIDPPIGAVVDSLPDGYEVKTLAGIEYYVLDGTYYSEVDAPEFEDKLGYEVVEI
jgi:hypothetical protein